MYVKVPLSLRNVEDLLAERGIDVSYETIRFWWNRFGPMFAMEIRRKRVERMRAFTHWRWHLDETYVKIGGQMHYLWRAVDHEGEVLESFATKGRDKAAALKFMKKLMKRHGSATGNSIDNVRSLTTPDVNYVSLNKNHSDLTRVLPWAGDHHGSEDIVKAFQGISTMWDTVAFNVKAAFGQGEDVAMFGEFSYRSGEVGKTVTSPFGIHLKGVDGKIAYILFLEDPLITSSSVQTCGHAIYKSLGNEVTVTA
jgi:hypothetical protein